MIDNPSCVICLINPKSPSNLGAILRAAGCFNASAIYYTGTRLSYALKYNTDTKNYLNKIPLIQISDIEKEIPKIFHKTVIELVVGAENLTKFNHPKKTCYIFGPEDGSVPQKIVDIADSVVYLPTQGCLNLAATANIVLYDRIAKSNLTYNDEMILNNRDTNNRLLVR